MKAKTEANNDKKTLTAQPKKMMHAAKKTVKNMGAKGGSTMLGTAAGAVVGAAIGGATGAALSDKKTRQQMAKTVTDLSKKAAIAADQLNQHSDEMTQTARRTLDDVSAQTHKLEKKTQN